MIRQGSLSNTIWFFIGTALVAALVIGIGGCGESNSNAGDSSEITVETGSLTKAQFIERADAICKKGRERFEKDLAALVASNEVGTGKDEQRTAATAVIKTIYVPNFERQIDRISALGAPGGDEEGVVAILEAIQKALVETEEHPLASVQGLGDFYPFAKAEKLARAYGLTTCGEN